MEQEPQDMKGEKRECPECRNEYTTKSDKGASYCSTRCNARHIHQSSICKSNHSGRLVIGISRIGTYIEYCPECGSIRSFKWIATEQKFETGNWRPPSGPKMVPKRKKKKGVK